MNIVIAIDSFKGCISSMDSGRLLRKAILDVYPEDDVAVFPLADGGEGTVTPWCRACTAASSPSL